KSEILRPVLNEKLSANSVGIVHVAIGGVHSVALTRDNKILTWGVNDEGTLARDTTKEKEPETNGANGVNGDAESDEDSDDDEITLNLKEASPLPVDSSLFPKGTGANGGIGFSPESKKEQRKPVQIPGLSNIVKVVAGSQHVLALRSDGAVFSWGCDEQHQLGRRRASRQHQTNPLVPEQCALPPGIHDVGVGLYHSFAVHRNGIVYAWGSNNFGQTAVSMSAGQNDAIVAFPTEVRSFRKQAKLVSIFGGKDHSIALTESGQCLIWGRIDNKALGIAREDMPESDIIYDEYNRPRILKQPSVLSS
ncbi:hypothetical protein LTS12_028994, partial [Elasticomyces elasticus]